MAKVSLEGAGKYSHHYPKVALIATVHSKGRDNCMAVAWHSSISHTPPLYGVSIAPKRLTMDMILESREFAINFMPVEKAALIASVGGFSGRKGDKFEKWGIEKEKSLKTSAPVLKDAYACYECHLVDHRTYGDHLWVVGEIVATHYEEELFTAEQLMDLQRINPALYIGDELYTTTVKDEPKRFDRKEYGSR
jgi:flavin reductase (DIM6/NTAB) family NADH-FMN oxidoreductase RutF